MKILGMGPVSALGNGKDVFYQGMTGKIEPNIEKMSVPTSRGSRSLGVYRWKDEGLDSYLNPRLLRRMDRFIKMSLLSSFMAFEDAGIDPLADNRENGESQENGQKFDGSRVGIVFGSGYGALETTFAFLDGVIDNGDTAASPTVFANSVHNSLASQTSIHLKLSGPCTTVTAYEDTMSHAFLTARAWLDEDKADYVLVGLGDQYAAMLGYALLEDYDIAEGRVDPCSPDPGKKTYHPGEGWISFLLGKDSPDDTGVPSQSNYPSVTINAVSASSGEIKKVLSDLGAGEPSSPYIFPSLTGCPERFRAVSSLIPDPSSIYSPAALLGVFPTAGAFSLAAAVLNAEKRKGEKKETEGISPRSPLIILESGLHNRYHCYSVNSV